MGTRNAFKNRCVLLCLITCGLSVAGCLSPITLNRPVIAYDEAVTDSLAKQLLINIARTHLIKRYTSQARLILQRHSTSG